jgi:hypothetical protein
MTIFGLIVLVFASVMAVWLAREGKIPDPFQWVVFAILIILWLFVALAAAGVGGLNQQLW